MGAHRLFPIDAAIEPFNQPRSPHGEGVAYAVNGKVLCELFFPIDGIPVVAILAWGDEHEFLCEVHDLALTVSG
jgi:hypothetical protein